MERWRALKEASLRVFQSSKLEQNATGLEEGELSLQSILRFELSDVFWSLSS